MFKRYEASWKGIEHISEWALTILILAILLTADVPRADNTTDSARAYTRPYEFNYVAWTVDATWLKTQQSALGLPGYVRRGDQLEAVMESVRLTETILRAENQLEIIFSDPTIPDKEKESAHIRAELDKLKAEGLNEEELTRAKNSLIGQRKVRMQDNGELSLMVALDELYGLGYDFFKKQDDRYRAVAMNDIKRIANKYFADKPHAVVVVKPATSEK
jgi:hypothetical protein